VPILTAMRQTPPAPAIYWSVMERDSRKGCCKCLNFVDPVGIEPTTSSLRTMLSTVQPPNLSITWIAQNTVQLERNGT
jgi:hypothetical protein